jgi:hypothetical protein
VSCRKYDDNKRVTILNKVLRNLGYNYILDNGKGWIAINEPTQGVVLNPTIINKVVTFNNYTRKKEQGVAEAIPLDTLRSTAGTRVKDEVSAKLKQNGPLGRDAEKAKQNGKPVKPGVAEGTELPGDFKLMGQNLFLKNLARNLKQRYPDATVKLSNDRVTAHHNEEDDERLTVMGTEVIDSGYIGVGLDDAFTESFQGVLVPTIKQTTEQLLAANPGMQPALFLSTDNWNPDAWAHIAAKLGYRLVAGDEELDENFADGKGPGRPGDSQRHGIPKGATMAQLEKASHAKGRKGQLARWQLNMRRGRKK